MAFKVVKIEFLEMHFINYKLRFYLFMIGNVQNILEHGTWSTYPNVFWHKIKYYNFDPYNALLAIAANIPVPFTTGFVVQGHI